MIDIFIYYWLISIAFKIVFYYEYILKTEKETINAGHQVDKNKCYTLISALFIAPISFPMILFGVIMYREYIETFVEIYKDRIKK